MKKVMILGCGPAGLFAAYAAERAGFDPVIVSKKRKSEMFGAQYLHRPIPGVSGEPFKIDYRLDGTADGYRDKVYGPGSRVDVSPSTLTGVHDAWDIREAYDLLFSRYQSKIIDMDIDSNNVRELIDVSYGASAAAMVSSIPASLLCHDETHGFQSQVIWSVGDAPERGIFSPITMEQNTVVCSGDRDVSWYRAANVLGFNTVEWPQNKRPPIENVSEVLKPIKTNCDCFPMIARVGRYGKWEKGVLSDSAYYDVYESLTNFGVKK